MSIKNGFKYKIRYVKPFSKGLRFQIGEKIKDAEPPEYINYQVTVFDAKGLNDGDTVTIAETNDWEVRKYDNRLFYSFVAKLKEQPQEEPQEQYGKALPDDSDQTLLPFDI